MLANVFILYYNDLLINLSVNIQGFLDAKGLPKWTPVSRVVEGTEPVMFKQYFSDWAREGVLMPLQKSSGIGAFTEIY